MGKTAATPVQRDKGQSFLRVFAIVERLVEAESPVTPAVLSQELGLPKATVHRLCQVLERERLVERNLDGRGLLPGPRLRAIGASLLSGAPLRVERQAILRRLAAQTGETCNITIPDGINMLYQDRVESEWPLRIQLPVGSRVPLHCTASGKLYLSSLPAAKRRRLLAELPLERYTPNTLTDPAALETALRQVRAEQVGVDDEEFLQGMVAVCVPILDGKGRFCATLATHGPVQRMSMAKAREQVPVLRRAAAALSALIVDEGEGPGPGEGRRAASA